MRRLTALSVRHPRLTLLAALALLAAGGYSALRTELSIGMDANLGADHPLVPQFDSFLERFGGGYPVLMRAGLDPIGALRAAISGVGEALITTSAALALGFLSLASSPFASIKSLSVLSAIAILGATLADLLVLPALIAAATTSLARAPTLRAAPVLSDNPPQASL